MVYLFNLLTVGNNSSVILQVYSSGAAGSGNDYAIDDIAFTEAQVDTILTTDKFVSNDFAAIGDTLEYTVVLRNTGQSTIQNIVFSDTIPNSAALIYNYTIDPVANPNRAGEVSVATNTVTTQVNNASLGNSTKLVDKYFATCGETVTYTIVLPNSGNITAFNVIVKDTLPSGTSLIPTSVLVNNVSAPGANPNTGITIPNIAPGATATLSFGVLVTCL